MLQRVTYGLWNGSEWMRGRNGLPVTSMDRALLAAHLHNWKQQRRQRNPAETPKDWQIWPISESGLPCSEEAIRVK